MDPKQLAGFKEEVLKNMEESLSEMSRIRFSDPKQLADFKEDIIKGMEERLEEMFNAHLPKLEKEFKATVLEKLEDDRVEDLKKKEKAEKKETTSKGWKMRMKCVTDRLEVIEKDEADLKTAVGAALDDVRVKSTLFVAFLVGMVTLQAAHPNVWQYWAIQATIILMGLSMKFLEYSSLTNLRLAKKNMKILHQLQNVQFDEAKQLLRNIKHEDKEQLSEEVRTQLDDLQKSTTLYRKPVELVSWATFGSWVFSALLSTMIPAAISIFMRHLGNTGKSDCPVCPFCHASAPASAPF